MIFLTGSQSVADFYALARRGALARSRWLILPWLVLAGVGASVLGIHQPKYAAALVVAIALIYLFFHSFERTVIGLLCLRSFLDFYSTYQVPAAFAIGLTLLVLLHVGRQLVLRQAIHTDPFWWFLIVWVLLQGGWVVLLPTGALGGTADMLGEALREWVRFFSLAMVYLLVMQLRDRISPGRLAELLLLSLAMPMFFAFLQSLPIDLPSFLQSNVGWQDQGGATNRIASTLGHYNSFASFSLLFMALSLWRTQVATEPLGWLLLTASVLYCLVATKSLTGLVMLLVFSGLFLLPKLKGKSILGAIALIAVLCLIFFSGLAQERLAELDSTPLLNPNLSFSRAAALQAADMPEFRNSFNWRLLQWRDLWMSWQQHPWLGYGLASAKKISVFDTTPHNDYLRFLVEEGVVGLSLFILFLIAQIGWILQAMRRSLPGSPQRLLSQVLFAFMIAMIVGMAAGNVMVHTATFFYWWVLLALLGWPWPTHFEQGQKVLSASVPIEVSDRNHGYDASAEVGSANLWERQDWETDIVGADASNWDGLKTYDLDVSGVDIYDSDRYDCGRGDP